MSTKVTFEMTEGIIERVDNATDSYIKFADGTMIAYLDITSTGTAINSAYGSLFIGTYVWTFPSTFFENPSVTCGIFKWGTSGSWGGVGQTPSTTGVPLRGYDISSRASGTAVDIQAIAVGRWK